MGDPENTFSNHWKTFLSLKGKKRFEYFWEYYKLQLGIVVLALILIVAALNHYVFNPPKKNAFTVAFYDVYVDYTVLDAVKAKMDELLQDDERARYECNAEAFNTQTGDMQYDMAMSQKFTANIMLAEIDLVLCRSDSLDMFREQDVAQHETDLTNTSYLPALGFDTNGVVAVTMSNGKHLDRVADVLQILLK